MIAFADEMRLGLLGCTRRRWNPRGEKLVQPIQKQFVWAWLFLAVDVTRWQLHWQWLANLKKESVFASAQQWHQAGVTLAVWDNAPAHGAKLMQTSPLTFVALPPYAPELNPAERVFEEVRRWVEGQVYDTLDAKQQAVTTYLTHLAADVTRLRSLVGWEWICAALPPAAS